MDDTNQQCTLAASALLAHLKAQGKTSKMILDDESIWMQVTLKTPPTKPLKAKKVPLPYPCIDGAEVCLITKEPGKDVKAKLQKAGIANITKVISLTKLRKEHKTFKLKQDLCDQFDSFLVDDRVYNLVLKTLGKIFNKAAKEPLPICLTYPNLKAEVQKSLLCSVLKVALGHTSVVRVGHSGLSAEQLAANMCHAAKVVSDKVPGGKGNVRGLYIKSALSVALPIYSDLKHLASMKTASAAGIDTAVDKSAASPIKKRSKKTESPIKKKSKKTMPELEEAEATEAEVTLLDQHAQKAVDTIKDMSQAKSTATPKKKKKKVEATA